MNSKGWETTSLGEIAEIIMGQSPAGETCNETGTGVPLLNGPTEFGNSHPHPVQFTTDPKKFSEIGDLLFCVRGSTTGRMNWADQRYAIGRGLAAIRHKKGEDYQPFLKGVLDYYLSLLLIEATGSTFPNVSSQQLNQLSIEIPNLHIQRRIASILSALDDKIELNRQTNHTLVAMAQAIFKEWFVDFRFPEATGEMQDSEIGFIPKEWRISKLEEVSIIIDCLHTKKPERIKEKTGFILLQLWNIQDSGLLDLNDAYWIAEEDYKEWISRIEATEGISVITNVGRVGATSRIPRNVKVALGRNMTAIKVKDNFPYDIFLILLLTSNWMKNEIVLKTDAGTILDSLNVRSIPKLRFVLPLDKILEAFEKLVKPIWVKMEENIQQIHILVQIRDSLLPKLMNGEIEL